VTPATNSDFWKSKRDATVLRDRQKRDDLVALGWEVVTVWECELRDPEPVVDRVVAFLEA
jgi:DNA mismatch endonuclease (patch repair protein)